MFALGLVPFVPLVDVAEVLHPAAASIALPGRSSIECLRRADRQDDHRHPDQRRLFTRILALARSRRPGTCLARTSPAQAGWSDATPSSSSWSTDMPVGQHARSGGDASQQTSPPTRSGTASCYTACGGPRDGLDVRRSAHPTLHWRFSYPQSATPAHLGSLQRGNITQSRQCYRALPRQSGHSAGRAPPGHHRGERPVQESSPLGNSRPQSSGLANPPQAARAAWGGAVSVLVSVALVCGHPRVFERIASQA
jgi:hypothetical protein